MRRFLGFAIWLSWLSCVGCEVGEPRHAPNAGGSAPPGLGALAFALQYPDTQARRVEGVVEAIVPHERQVGAGAREWVMIRSADGRLHHVDSVRLPATLRLPFAPGEIIRIDLACAVGCNHLVFDAHGRVLAITGDRPELGVPGFRIDAGRPVSTQGKVSVSSVIFDIGGQRGSPEPMVWQRIHAFGARFLVTGYIGDVNGRRSWVHATVLER